MVTPRNLDLAASLELMGDLLELDGADRFRARAYRLAARSIARTPFEVVEHVLRGERLPGVGEGLAAKIRGYAKYGALPGLEPLKAKWPPSLLPLFRVARLNAKRIRLLHDKLGIRTIDDLRSAAQEGRLATLPGVGARVQDEVLFALGGSAPEPAYRKADLAPAVLALLERLLAWPGVLDVRLVGGLRRRCAVVGDVDILLTVGASFSLPDALGRFGEQARVLSAEKDVARVQLLSGLRVDLYTTTPAGKGVALVERTGAAAHVAELRRRGRGRLPAAESEAELYAALGLKYVEPELREGRGEIEAAARDALPRLIESGDLQGDLHAHTDATDGRDTLEQMAEAAAARGLKYLAVTDHTKSLKLTNGQDEKRLAKQIEAIDRLNAKTRGFRLLKGAEVDILEDGSLDLSDDILRQLDLTVCSVHSKFTLPPEKQTERVLRAMEHPAFRILGHPTGRLLLRRKGHPLDVDRLIARAKELGRILELNAQPDRLDLDDLACRRAKEAGVRVAINSDAHGTGELDFTRFGVDQARRGWLEAKDVVNTLPLPDLLRLLA
jgi:DNA polymerase (family X)